VTKDYHKEVFIERKSLIPYTHLHYVSEPHFDELSVITLDADMMAQASMAKFLPYPKTKSDTPERENFFNVINTGSAASRITEIT
jgi:hypothetical protein